MHVGPIWNHYCSDSLQDLILPLASTLGSISGNVPFIQMWWRWMGRGRVGDFETPFLLDFTLQKIVSVDCTHQDFPFLLVSNSLYIL